MGLHPSMGIVIGLDTNRQTITQRFVIYNIWDHYNWIWQLFINYVKTDVIEPFVSCTSDSDNQIVLTYLFEFSNYKYLRNSNEKRFLSTSVGSIQTFVSTFLYV